MSLEKELVINRLKTLRHPFLSGNIIERDLVSDLLITDNKVFFSIKTSPKHLSEFGNLRSAAQKSIQDISGTRQVLVALIHDSENLSHTPDKKPSKTSPNPLPESENLRSAPSPTKEQPENRKTLHKETRKIPGVASIIGIASGKGGVGKSTTAINLSLSLASRNLKIGILDADIHGASIPHILNVHEKPVITDNIFQPIEKFGLKIMSIGFLVDPGTPIIWRGPMVTSALMQMLFHVHWGDLDILIIDFPPGTGDVHLTIAQKTELTGIIIISTPQDLALMNARKGLYMFQKLETPILGIIENMSYFIAPDTGNRYNIFGHGGGEKEAHQLGVPFLGCVPLEMKTCAFSDQGTPIVVAEPKSKQSMVYSNIAGQIDCYLKKISFRQEQPSL